ncbi:MAG: 2-dehydropantoate 2-reductase [Gaiellaceae bacterium]|nr:2-dehydropantoate 2-reductase [Gaiellaceae bacterium]
MPSSVTVGVLGPGAVGGVLAVGLVRAGVRVVCIARPDTAALITSEGLTLRHGVEGETARPEATTELLEPVDLLLVTVKAPALDDALGRIQAPAETVVPLLNGIEHMDTIRRRLPNSRAVGATIGWIEAWLERPGVIVQNTPRTLMTVASDAGAQTVELLRNSGANVREGGSEAAVLWEKLVRQAPVAAATALTQRPIGELRSDPAWRHRLEQAVAECCAAAAADGVDVTPAAQWEIIDGMPPALTSSTARDIAAGRPSELDAITGAAVRAAHRLGIEAPVLERLLAETESACRVPSH